MNRAVRWCWSQQGVLVGASSMISTVCSMRPSRLAFGADFFAESKAHSENSDIQVRYEHSFQPLESDTLTVQQQAYGIPFHISDEGAIDAACRHHGATVKIHESEKLLMPFWLFRSSCGGAFKAEIYKDNPQYMTRKEQIWMSTPLYHFSYPFEDHFVFNQVSASYLHPFSYVEKCLMGMHIPSMLIQRFELLEAMEDMPIKAKLIPFVMSTATALKTVESRLSRSMLMQFIDKELKKYHGSFMYSNVQLCGVRVNANSVRPVFLPMYRMLVSTKSSSLKVPVYVCGATGKAAGPVLRVSKGVRTAAAVVSAAATLVAGAPMLITPEVGMAAAAGAALGSSFLLHLLKRLQFARDEARALGELKTTGILNYASDKNGYRWSVEAEEKQEYEYREELRRRARRKDDFEQRVKEETARDEARARGMKFDPSSRRRNDLKNVDPLGFYKLLGLEGRESASHKDIQAAFREVSKLHHPDLHVDRQEDAKKMMQRILEAYKVLRDPKLKKDYDSGKMAAEREREEGDQPSDSSRE